MCNKKSILSGKTGRIFTLDTRDLNSYNVHTCHLEIDETISITVGEINSLIDKVESGNWVWWKNTSCKYIRIFSVENTHYVFNRYGEQITLKDMEFQYE